MQNREPDLPLSKSQKINEIAFVQYKDHHCFEDDLSKEEILAVNDYGDKSFILTECGFVIRETRDYIILGSHREQQRLPPLLDEMKFKNISRVLKPNIISIQKFKVKDWEFTL